MRTITKGKVIRNSIQYFDDHKLKVNVDSIVDLKNNRTRKPSKHIYSKIYLL